MKTLKIFASLGPLLLLMLALSGCETSLDVTNLNEPDKERALATEKDVEGLLGSSFRDFWFSQTDYYGTPWSLSTMADEFTSSWGNSGMRDLSSEPRMPFDNTSSYGYRVVSEGPWEDCYAAISSASDALSQIAQGMRFIDETGKDNTERGKAWGKFVQGISLGFLAIRFDKAFIVDENTDFEAEALETSPYNEVCAAAIQKLEECIAICQANNFEIPEAWWPGNYYTNVELAKVAHSFIARYMAGVARDPAERAAADWASIKSHAQQGITEDFGTYNDGEYWWSYLHGLFSNDTWTRADYKCIGPADTSGEYAAWLATPVQDRNYILIHTDDRRITGAEGPESDGKYVRYYGPCAFRANRGTYHFSYYGWYKYLDYYENSYVGWAHIMSLAEMNLLRAEAELRLGNAQAAADLINLTRVPIGELPPADASNVGAVSDERYAHGSLWAMLKYEKGVEIAQKNCGVAWTDRRGWGTLVPGTVIHFPIPGSELELLMMPYYTFGGVGKEGGAPKMKLRLPPRMDMPRL